MPTLIHLPLCLESTFRQLFPTLDFARIRFYDGIPWALDRGRYGLTVPASDGFRTINLYLAKGSFDPCTTTTFLRIAHELVHALQIQSTFTAGYGLGMFHPFLIGYISCFLTTFSSGRNNPYEREAYDYADGHRAPGAPPGRLRRCIEAPFAIHPCDCTAIPWPGLDKLFWPTLLARCPDIIKRDAENSPAPCFGSS